MPKRWRIRPHDADGIARLGREAGVSSVVAQLLICRGICDPAAAKEFLDPKISGLRDPELLPGLTAAADRIHAAVSAGKQITVYGDYDADGMTATAILLGCLQLMGAKVDFYVPHRIDEGYGLNDEAPAHVGPARQPGGDHRRLWHRQRQRSPNRAGTRPGTDHHRPSRNGRRIARSRGDRHPRLPGHSYPFTGLSGTGVAFKLAVPHTACGIQLGMPISCRGSSSCSAAPRK